MNRSVRNGLAIAGMAGGIFFLGQAVASADDGGTQAADANSTVDQSNASTDGGGGGVNLNGSSADVPSNRPAAPRAAADVESGTEDAGPIPAGSRQRLGVTP